jgi:hypothetical protein
MLIGAGFGVIVTATGVRAAVAVPRAIGDGLPVMDTATGVRATEAGTGLMVAGFGVMVTGTGVRLTVTGLMFVGAARASIVTATGAREALAKPRDSSVGFPVMVTATGARVAVANAGLIAAGEAVTSRNRTRTAAPVEDAETTGAEVALAVFDPAVTTPDHTCSATSGLVVRTVSDRSVTDPMVAPVATIEGVVRLAFWAVA